MLRTTLRWLAGACLVLALWIGASLQTADADWGYYPYGGYTARYWSGPTVYNYGYAYPNYGYYNYPSYGYYGYPAYGGYRWTAGYPSSGYGYYGAYPSYGYYYGWGW